MDKSYIIPTVALGAAVIFFLYTYRRQSQDVEEEADDDGIVEVDLEDSAIVVRRNPTDGLVGKARKLDTDDRKSDHCESANASTVTNSDHEHALLPGTAKIFVKTYGCSHNTSDTEFMMGQLKEYGYSFTTIMDEADLVLLNSCTVKNPSQDSVINLSRKAQKRCPVVIAGCVTQADSDLVNSLEDNVSVLGLHHVNRVVEVVEEALNGNKVVLIEPLEPMTSAPSLPPLTLPKIRRNPFVEIISINTGCLGNCTYCKTKQARGTLQSYPIDKIVERVRVAVKEGVQQIWLTSEDTGAFGLDIGTNIVHLLRALVNELPEHCMLRLGMTNPPYIMKHINEIGEILTHPRVFEFIHIPVQSGSEKVLIDMQRDYGAATFRRLCRGLREKCPDLTIATDFICGFPTERPEDHDKSLELIKEFKFPIVNISQFYGRPGTAAVKMKKLDGRIVKQRSTEVTSLFESYTCNEKYEGCIERVWFSDTNETHNQTIGHTKTHVKVLVPRDDALLGRNRMCKIISTHKWHLNAEVENE